MLCLVCWVATAGIGGLPRRKSEELEQLPIARWRSGTIDAIVDTKSTHFGNPIAFEKVITNNFCGMGLASNTSGGSSSGDPGARLLVAFAKGLQYHLFDNGSVGPECCGTNYIYERKAQSFEPEAAQDFPPLYDEVQNEPKAIDPFEKRAEKNNVAVIAKDLHTHINRYWNYAMDRQEKAKQALKDQAALTEN
ncbi:hypothetical protein GGI06_005971 [Coemansia sp. S85]|nr:hypothetical protein GGI06_005971 [Coemansia sp. S85]